MATKNGRILPLDGPTARGYNGNRINGRTTRPAMPSPEVLLGRHAEALCQVIAGIVRRVMSESAEKAEGGAEAGEAGGHDENGQLPGE